ncbi:MAG: LuxR C-terminal-related transcriptional regulator [Solirubrobacteraceae bacterium]
MSIEHQPITLVIAEFEDIVSLGLQSMVDDDPNLRLIAGDVAQDEIAPALRAHSPDVAILNFASLAAPAQLRELSEEFPDVRLVVLANNPSSGEARQLIGFGATACLGQSTEARDVIQAIYLASRGMHVLPPDAEQDYEPSGPAPLTPREADVLELLQAGAANAEIAATLQVGVETVRTHARHIYRKLGVSTRRELRSTA